MGAPVRRLQVCILRIPFASPEAMLDPDTTAAARAAGIEVDEELDKEALLKVCRDRRAL